MSFWKCVSEIIECRLRFHSHFRFVLANDRRLHYDKHGGQEDPSRLVIHSFTQVGQCTIRTKFVR